MKSTSKLFTLILIGCLFPFTIIQAAELLPDVPAGAQAVSLEGEALFAAEPNAGTIANLAAARADYEADPDAADNIIWYGRRIAYAGDYRRAIEVFSEGVEKFPPNL